MNYRIHEPSLHATPVLDLRPTQMTLGMSEVSRKRKSWKSQGAKALAGFLAHHMVPVVVGPGGRRYLIDHHHLARALHDEGRRQRVRHHRRRLRTSSTPTRSGTSWISTAGRIPSTAGGAGAPNAPQPRPRPSPRWRTTPTDRSPANCAISAASPRIHPFSEFVWADFLRRRIKPKDLRKSFEAATEKALTLAKSEEANYLPGWCAPHGGKAAIKKGKRNAATAAAQGD